MGVIAQRRIVLFFSLFPAKCVYRDAHVWMDVFKLPTWAFDHFVCHFLKGCQLVWDCERPWDRFTLIHLKLNSNDKSSIEILIDLLEEFTVHIVQVICSILSCNVVPVVSFLFFWIGFPEKEPSCVFCSWSVCSQECRFVALYWRNLSINFDRRTDDCVMNDVHRRTNMHILRYSFVYIKGQIVARRTQNDIKDGIILLYFVFFLMLSLDYIDAKYA